MKASEVRIGSFRHRIILKQRIRVPDGGGGSDTDWREVDTVWGNVRPAGARESYHAMRLAHTVTHVILMRYRDDITILADWKFTYAGRDFNIRGLIDIEEAQRFYQVMVEEGVAQ